MCSLRREFIIISYALYVDVEALTEFSVVYGRAEEQFAGWSIHKLLSFQDFHVS